MKRPNFFIVGAPKCGTTAMNDYLNKHPDIFMAEKEIHYFGADLQVTFRLAESEYLKHFQGAQHKKIVGEASVWYLFSKTAAAEIKHFAPDAKILIMLRNPVEVLYSLHSQHLYDGNEDVLDFETAINLDAERKSGRQLPNAVDFTQLPPYIDTVRFSEQVRRYLEVFGGNQVHVIFYEDFKKDTATAVAETMQFLGVEPRLEPAYGIVNSNKKIQYLKIHRLLKKPPAALKAAARLLMPFKSVRHFIMRFVLKKNIKSEKRIEMKPELQEKLRKLVIDDIEKLSMLLNRDLSSWLS